MKICILFSLLFFIFLYVYNICNSCKCKITLVIPTINSTFISCRKRIIKMINESYLKPSEVLLIISQYNETKVVKTIFNGMLFITIYRKGKHNQADNRNIGIRLAKCKYISFFDSDDIMSKNRIHLIYYSLNNNMKVDIILHSYTLDINSLDDDYISPKNVKFMSYNYSYEEIYKSYYMHRNISIKKKFCCYFLNKTLKIHNAWLSGRTNILKMNLYNESWKLFRFEDTELNNRLIMKKYNVLLLNCVLGVFIPHSKCI